MTLLDQVFASVYDPVLSSVERWLRPHREFLAANLSGQILDLGTGTGRQLPYLAANPDCTITGIDPEPHMLKKARDRIADIDTDMQLVRGVAESLPYPDASFDAVVVSLSLCTVENPRLAVMEVERVLKPGGELRVLEHVKARSPVRTVQQAINPCWRIAARGCCLTRETDKLLAERRQLVTEEIQWLRTPIPFFRARYRRCN